MGVLRKPGVISNKPIRVDWPRGRCGRHLFKIPEEECVKLMSSASHEHRKLPLHGRSGRRASGPDGRVPSAAGCGAGRRPPQPALTVEVVGTRLLLEAERRKLQQPLRHLPEGKFTSGVRFISIVHVCCCVAGVGQRL